MTKYVALLFILVVVMAVKIVSISKKCDEKRMNRKINSKEEIIDTSKAEYTYDEMCEDLKVLSRKYKEKITVDIIGTTCDDRNIYEIVFGTENPLYHILIHAGIHGCEYMNSMLLMKQLEYYLNLYEKGSYKGITYSELFKDTAFHIVPMANPDGITISQLGIKGIRNTKLKKLIKKCYKEDINDGNTNEGFEEYLKKWKANANGVDLNRNFNASWDALDQTCHPSFRYYKGKTYESEPETKAMVKLTLENDFIGTVSYHSSGRIIYWDYKDNLKKDGCSTMADIAAEITGYEKAASDIDYSEVVAGGYKDWVTSNEDNPISGITIETGQGECPLDIEEFKEVWKANRDIWAAYAFLLHQYGDFK